MALTIAFYAIFIIYERRETGVGKIVRLEEKEGEGEVFETFISATHYSYITSMALA